MFADRWKNRKNFVPHGTQFTSLPDSKPGQTHGLANRVLNHNPIFSPRAKKGRLF